MNIEQGASLHEATVKDAELHAASRARRKPRATPGGRSSKVRTELQVDPEVMAAAKQLLQLRPGTKLRIVDATTVIVE